MIRWVALGVVLGMATPIAAQQRLSAETIRQFQKAPVERALISLLNFTNTPGIEDSNLDVDGGGEQPAFKIERNILEIEKDFPLKASPWAI